MTDDRSTDSKRAEWDVMRITCRGPCWNGVWLVFEKVGHDVGPYHLNAAGNVKRFRSEGAARRVAAQLTRHNSIDRGPVRAELLLVKPR